MTIFDILYWQLEVHNPKSTRYDLILLYHLLQLAFSGQGLSRGITLKCHTSYLWTPKTINYVWKYFYELFMLVLPLIFGYFWAGSEFNPFAWISCCVISLLLGFGCGCKFELVFDSAYDTYIRPHHSIQQTLDLIKR